MAEPELSFADTESAASRLLRDVTRRLEVERLRTGGPVNVRLLVDGITSLQVDEASRFTSNPAHHEYLNSKDDVWFTRDTTEVLLRVAPEAAHYFVRRSLLPQQQQRADVDGSLLVTTHINHPQQLLALHPVG